MSDSPEVADWNGLLARLNAAADLQAPQRQYIVTSTAMRDAYESLLAENGRFIQYEPPHPPQRITFQGVDVVTDDTLPPQQVWITSNPTGRYQSSWTWWRDQLKQEYPEHLRVSEGL